jgi:hypothetical protein
MPRWVRLTMVGLAVAGGLALLGLAVQAMIGDCPPELEDCAQVFWRGG